MRCEECQSLLADYHYGELESASRKVVIAHLGTCGPCATEYCRLHAALAQLADAAAAEPSPALHLRLRAEVERQFKPPAFNGLFKGLLSRGVLAWLRRPIPTYQVAALLGLVASAAALASSLGDPRPAVPRPHIETPGRAIVPLIPGYDAPQLGAVSRNLL